MNTSTLRTALFGTLLLAGVVGSGCVADRPSRNGVFDENQYVRKDFLIQGTDANGNAPGIDPGWFLKTTVTEVSTPNLLGSAIGVDSGVAAPIQLVRFRVTSDTLQMIDQIQLSTPQAPDPTTGAPGPVDTTGTTSAIINAWPVTNVDLKYRVNLDGEKTNFYEENQELDWQQRQWVKVNFDKNDMSDLAPLGALTNDMIAKCGDMTDASATIVPNSFNVEPGATTADDYMEFTIQVTIPMTFTGTTPDDTTCLTAYGPMLAKAAQVNRTTVTVNLKYSFMRATPTSALTAPGAYKPLVIDEKDPIHLKYGPIEHTVYNFDNQTQLFAATQFVERFDPTKPIVWYFDQNFPEYWKHVFVGDTTGNPGIQQGTNALLTSAGVKARVSFLNYNDQSAYKDAKGPARSYGDIRYNMLRWVSDEDMQDAFAGVTIDGVDPRTGQELSALIEFNDFAVKDYYVDRMDAFLTTVGASGGLQSGKWATGHCTQDQQLVTDQVINEHNASSTLYTKMQSYLGLHGPDPQNDHLGPADFVANNAEDPDFMNAYMAIVPYELFADPDANLFVTREGGNGVYGPAAVWTALQGEAQWNQLTAAINNGQEPYTAVDGIQGVYNAAAFANQMRAATIAHRDLGYMMTLNAKTSGRHMDAPGSFSLEAVMEQDAQRCINGEYESEASWTQHIIDLYWQDVFWHEFGHSMGLEHNFMGNIDQPNFTTARDSSGKPMLDSTGHTIYNMYSSSVMEYSSNPARFHTQAWGDYDKGAIAWIYANDAKQPDDPAKDMQSMNAKTRTGEVPGPAGQEGAGAYPWKDPLGFCAANDPDCKAGQERSFLFCNENYTKYSPICRAGDLGVTPSQIVANDIDVYEWEYQWRNFRDYRKVWDASAYGNQVAGFVTDLRRFLSQWAFDWSPGDIAATLYRIGVTPPANAPSAVDYYSQLTYKFLVEMSKANQMIGAFDEAVIQQSNGERPYATVYDKFYGDVTQQGIILDKYFAMQDFVGLWQSDNYDQNQAGAYISSWSTFDFDLSYQSVSETAIDSMIGGQYAVYPYFIPTALALFAQDTHNPAFLQGTGRVEAKDWIGGWTFPDETFLINWFRTLAVNACNVQGNQSACANGCNTFSTCTYDPTDPTQVSQDPQTLNFTGPDGLTYTYAYIPSRNEWVLARQDRNIVTFKLIDNYNTDIYATKDDGTQGAYTVYEYPIKYTIDSYQAYEGAAPAAAGQ